MERRSRVERHHIFVGGDVYTGPKFAIDAIEAGKCAAESLHRFVQPGTSLTIGRNRRDFIELNKDDLVVRMTTTTKETDDEKKIQELLNMLTMVILKKVK